MYDLYKPLRNELRKNALGPSLYVIWAWMQHLQLGTELPADLEVPMQVRWQQPGPALGIYEWDLAILAKELLANATVRTGSDFRSWKRFSTAINKLKDLNNAISGRYEQVFRSNILVELYRHA